MRARSRILDVGAGRGLLSHRLREIGAEVTAIDKSAKAICIASELGIRVDLNDICTYQNDKKFDAIIFSMAAHHVIALGEAFERCNYLLKADGKLILEEYAIEDADESSATWFYGTNAFITCLLQGELSADMGDFLNDPFAAWVKQHSTNEDHHFNSGNLIIKEVERHFEIISTERVPYFYRYFAAKIGPLAQDSGIASKIYDLEKKLISIKKVKPLGLRIIARKIK